MSDQDRGAYAPPTDAPLAFDARQPVRGSRPLPLTLIISILVLGGLATAIFLFYRQGVRQAGQPPQAVGTPVAGIKTPPPAEAQPTDPAAGLSIYKTEGGQSSPAQPPQPTFTPAPEQPARRAEAQGAPAVVVAPPAPLPAATPAPALRPALPAQPPAAAQPPPAKLAQAAPKPLTPPPSARTEVTPPAKTAAAAPAPAKPKTPPAPAKSAAETPAPKAVAGAAAVQIGAFSSQALADKGWNDAAGIAPGLAAGKGKSVEKVDKDGKTLFRTQVTGFASRADATAFCDKLKAAGKACFVK